MNNKYIAIAAYLGAITVALGAFGAHALKEQLSPEAMQIFDTAVKYQFYHVFALLAAGIIYHLRPAKIILAAARFFIAGIVFFCGSLYVLTAIVNGGNDSLKWIGAITPVGGICFIAGWVCVAMGAGKNKI